MKLDDSAIAGLVEPVDVDCPDADVGLTIPIFSEADENAVATDDPLESMNIFIDPVAVDCPVMVGLNSMVVPNTPVDAA